MKKEVSLLAISFAFFYLIILRLSLRFSKRYELNLIVCPITQLGLHLTREHMDFIRRVNFFNFFF